MKLRVSDVTFEYDSRPVLEDVSLAVDAGEVLGVVGPNGAGKSTLLQTLNRILTPKAQAISVDGTPIEALSRDALAKTMGYVPQRDEEGFPSTVFDTVLMGRKPYIDWTPDEADLEQVRSVIARLGLEALAMRDVQSLSGGQRQKVLIARALAQDPEVLLLDEPTSDLDLYHQLDVLDVIREQAADGIAAVMAIHDLNMAARYSDKLVVLKDGQVYASGGPEILTEGTLEAVYEVEATVRTDGDHRVILPEAPLG